MTEKLKVMSQVPDVIALERRRTEFKLELSKYNGDF